MAMVTFKRTFRTGFLNFSRNSLVSLSSILVVTITLCVFGGVLLFQHVLETTLLNVENKVDVTVYVVPGTDESAILSLKDKVADVPEVASVDYVSENQALADFRARHADDQTTLQALDELDQNPIGAMLNIKAKDISQYESIAKFFDTTGTLGTGSQSIIDHVDYNKNKGDIDAIKNILANGRRLGLVVTLILILISIIMTFNTMRLAIYFAREEISVMRLVGASRAHVQGPFIVEGALYGFVATLLTLVLFLPITYWFGTHMTDFFGGVNLFHYYLGNILSFAGILFVFGAGLGAFSSILASRKYLKV